MNRLILLISLCSLVFACTEQPQQTTVKEPTKAESPVLPDSPKAFAFYKLDEKYSTETDSLIIQQWLEEKSEWIRNNLSAKSIFSHSGGGPNNTEWNPATDLYIAVLHPDSTTSPQLLINDTLYEQRVPDNHPHLTWYRVELALWENQVRPIDSTDIPNLYPSDFLEAVHNGTHEPVTDLTYGDVLRFDVLVAGDTLVHYFHAAYGE